MRLGTARALAILVAGLCVAPLAAHPHAPIGVRVNPQDRTEIEVHDYWKQETRVLFRSGKGAISEALVSPYFSRVAVIETTSGEVEGNRFATVPQNNLLLLDTRGEILRSVDRDVRQVVFSPDGRRVGFVTGTYSDGGIGFRPTGAYILDGDSGEVETISGVDSPFEIQWTGEGAIYLKVLAAEGGQKVMRYDVRSKAVTESAKASFNYSPDGEFYLALPYETVEVGECRPQRGVDSCLRVVNRRTDEVVSFFSADSLGNFDGWIGGEDHQLIFSKREFETPNLDGLAYGIRKSENFVYDAATTALIDTFECERPGGASEGFWITSPRAIHCRDAVGKRFVRGFERPPAPVRPRPAPVAPEPPPLPTPTALQPAADSEWNFANPLFTWQGLDGADRYDVTILTDAEGSATVAEAEGLEQTRWRADPLPMGEYYWQVTALAGAAVVGAPMSPVRFVILSGEADFEPPEAAARLLGPQTEAAGALVCSGTAQLDVDVQDSLAGVESTRILVNGRQVLPEERDQPWQGGANTVEIEAEDRAGNVSAMAPLHFNVDKLPPEISWRFVRPGDLSLDRDLAKRVEALRRSGADGNRQNRRWLEVSDDPARGWPLSWGPDFSLGAGSGERRKMVKSDQPQLFISSPGAWAFADSLDGDEGDVLWVNAVDKDSRVVDYMTIRVNQNGADYVLEISAADIFGNERSVFFPLQDP